MTDPRHPEEASDGTEISGEAPGVKGKIKGYRSMDVVLMVFVISVLTGAGYVYRDQQDQRRTEQAASKAEHSEITAAVKALDNTMQEQTYVLTLKQEERERLNLSMPPSLRVKLYEDRRAR